jgi:hypothetical protein
MATLENQMATLLIQVLPFLFVCTTATLAWFVCRQRGSAKTKQNKMKSKQMKTKQNKTKTPQRLRHTQ